MARLPLLKPLELARVLSRLGFKLISQEGSHMLFRHPRYAESQSRGRPWNPLGDDLRLGDVAVYDIRWDPNPLSVIRVMAMELQVLVLRDLFFWQV